MVWWEYWGDDGYEGVDYSRRSFWSQREAREWFFNNVDPGSYVLLFTLVPGTGVIDNQDEWYCFYYDLVEHAHRQ